jgi:hypothetical protein
MSTVKDILKEEVRQLVDEGKYLVVKDMMSRHSDTVGKPSGKSKATAAEDRFSLQDSYQAWYTKALPVVKQILPERYQEFIEQYKLDKRKEITFLNYTISDYLIGVTITRGWTKEEVFNPFIAFNVKLEQQLSILKSCLSRLDSAIADIHGTLQAELFDDELTAAEELWRRGHLRAAGTLAGVTLERHLTSVAVNHTVKIGKKEPTIADFNDAFKNEGIYDLPTWRFIQRLGDIRNLSAHFKNREPTKDEVDEMIKGVQKILKTVF